MYNEYNFNSGPIQISPTESFMEKVTEFHIDLDVLNESSLDIPKLVDSTIYTEAVFAHGKKQVQCVEKCFEAVKAELEAEVQLHREAKGNKDKFDPESFWKHQVWKNLEDAISKVFGFRIVSINPYVEKYNKKSDDFESKELNAFVFRYNRFPIEGLVTDKGFYDKTKSLSFFCYITLGLIRTCNADEITAILLHELGHAVDPALVDIRYVSTNALTKYITDRRKDLTDNERRAMEKNGAAAEFVIPGLIWLLLILLPFIPAMVSSVGDFFSRLFLGKKRWEEKKLEKIKKELKKDKYRFNRQNYSEAFADNFARMYGYGPQLISGLKKIGSDVNAKRMKSRFHRENRRVKEITKITVSLIKDEHKTDIHRIHSLLKEYEEDIKDPNIPAPVKEQLKADKKELEAVLNQYQNNYSDFQNRVNRMIIEELNNMDKEDAKKAKSEENKTSEKKPAEKKSDKKDGDKK